MKQELELLFCREGVILKEGRRALQYLGSTVVEARQEVNSLMQESKKGILLNACLSATPGLLIYTASRFIPLDTTIGVSAGTILSAVGISSLIHDLEDYHVYSRISKALPKIDTYVSPANRLSLKRFIS